MTLCDSQRSVTGQTLYVISQVVRGENRQVGMDKAVRLQKKQQHVRKAMEKGQDADRTMVNKITKGEEKDVANRRKKNEGSSRPSDYMSET